MLGALDTRLELTPNSKRKAVDAAIKRAHCWRGDSQGQICEKMRQALTQVSCAALIPAGVKSDFLLRCLSLM
jgi:hypothetical protein